MGDGRCLGACCNGRGIDCWDMVPLRAALGTLITTSTTKCHGQADKREGV